MKPILPGSTLGVLGSGQLGRMFAIAARQMGYRVHTFSPDIDTPTGQVADVEMTASYDDLDAVRQFAKNVAVVTFEFENVPAATAAAAAERAPVRPGGDVLHTTQHRLREKTFLTNTGFRLRRSARFDRLKTCGSSATRPRRRAENRVVRLRRKRPNQGPHARRSRGGHRRSATWIEFYEAFVEFECEVSVVAARGSMARSHIGA